MARKKNAFPCFIKYIKTNPYEDLCMVVPSYSSSYERMLYMTDIRRSRVAARIKDMKKEPESKECSYIAYRFLGMPTPEQKHLLAQNAGANRFMWNTMLADREDSYKETGKMVKRPPAYYKKLKGLEWLNEMDSNSFSNTEIHLNRAYSDFFKGERGKPRFKKKGRDKDSYTTCETNNNIKFSGNSLKLPKIPGFIRLKAHRNIKEGGRLKNVTVTREPDGKWYFSILFEYAKETYSLSDSLEEYIRTGDPSCIKAAGLDMSLPYMYVDHEGNHPSYVLDGHTVCFQKNYRKYEKKIAREQRKLSRMEKDSHNYLKQLLKISSLHAKAKHARKDFIEQITARLSSEYDIISIEDLDIAAMKKTLKLGKSLSDNGWGAFTARLEEKCLQKGKILIRVDKWFPSSRKCSCCGHIHKELALSDRVYECPECGSIMDRDKQAAINLREEGLSVFKEAYHVREAA